MQIARKFFEENKPLIDSMVKEIGEAFPDVRSEVFPAIMASLNDMESQLIMVIDPIHPTRSQPKLTPLETYVMGTLMASGAASAAANNTGDPSTNALMEEVGDTLIHIGMRYWNDAQIKKVMDLVESIFRRATPPGAITGVQYTEGDPYRTR